MTPDVSVIICTHNRANVVGEAIECICKQTHQDWELIIVDDGSTDNTKEVLEAYTHKDARIKVIMQKNKGLAATRNTGIKNAQAKWVLFHDDDDYSHPQMLELYLARAQEKPKANIIIGMFHYLDAQNRSHGDASDNYLTGNLLLRSALNALGGFHPFFHIAEDSDLFYRWQESGSYNPAYIGRIIYFYRLPQAKIASLTASQDYALYQLIAAFLRWCRTKNRPCSIDATTTLNQACEQINQQMPAKAKNNLLRQHLINPVAYRYFLKIRRYSLQRLKQDLQHFAPDKTTLRRQMLSAYWLIFKGFITIKRMPLFSYKKRRTLKELLAEKL